MRGVCAVGISNVVRNSFFQLPQGFSFLIKKRIYRFS
jgi:hypothetical protein